MTRSPAGAPDDTTIRAFVGLSLGRRAQSALATAIAELRLLDWAHGVRWVRQENLHLTLRFLGSIEPDTVAGLLRALAGRLSEVEAFEFELCELSLLPSSRRPRVVTVGVTQQQAISALALAVEEAVAAAGRAKEKRALRPHVTIGRFGRPVRRRIDLAGHPVETARVEVQDVVLYRSRLDQAGAQYSALGRVALGRESRLVR